MTQNTESPLDDAQRKAIAREYLAKVLVKAIPEVGEVINEIVFETAKSETDARDKVTLMAQLDAIKSRQRAQDIDLGDVLSRLDQQAFHTQEIRDAIMALALYLKNSEPSGTTSHVDAAVARALPGYTVGATHSDEIGALDRNMLQKAIERQLTPAQLMVLIRDIPNASNWAGADGGKAELISPLLLWAESTDGSQLNRIFTCVKRSYPNFTLNPQTPPSP